MQEISSGGVYVLMVLPLGATKNFQYDHNVWFGVFKTYLLQYTGFLKGS